MVNVMLAEATGKKKGIKNVASIQVFIILLDLWLMTAMRQPMTVDNARVHNDCTMLYFRIRSVLKVHMCCGISPKPAYIKKVIVGTRINKP